MWTKQSLAERSRATGAEESVVERGKTLQIGKTNWNEAKESRA